MLGELPVTVLDALLGQYLTDNDLRVIHQVSRTWGSLVEERPIINNRRLALAAQIREDKENIPPSNRPVDPLGSLRRTTVPKIPSSPITIDELTNQQHHENSKDVSDNDEKLGSDSRALRAVTATVNNEMVDSLDVTPEMSGSESQSQPLSTGSTRITLRRNRNQRISSTPKSHFQRRLEAGQGLIKGQVLFSCPSCKSPVPSPVPSPVAKSSDFDTSHRKESLGSSCSSLLCTPEDSHSVSSRVDTNSNFLSYKSPGSECISMSMIATPPYTPQDEERNRSQGSFARNSDNHESRVPTNLLLSISAIMKHSASESPREDMNVTSSLASIDPQPTSSLAESADTGIGSSLSCITEMSPVIERSVDASISCLDLELNQQFRVKVSESDYTTPETPPPSSLQCPICSYRFCSCCKFGEHSGRPCRLVGDFDENGDDDLIGENHLEKSEQFNRIPRSKSSTRSQSSNSSNSSMKSKKKSSLRRLTCY